MDPNVVDAAQLFSVKGMVAIITGGGVSIGLMMTKALANNGASKIYIVGRRQDILEEAAKSASPHGNIIPLVGDVTSKESLMQVAEQIKQEVGYVNLVVCNSGTYPPPVKANPKETSLEDFADTCLSQNVEDWNLGFATNTTSIAFTTFAFLKLLDAGNKKANLPGVKSQVLVTTSIAGFLRNPINFGAYPVTKAGATHMIKCLSGTLAPYSIRVNGIAPGLFPSDMAAPLIARLVKDQDPSVEGVVGKDFIPAARLGSMSDMAGTVLYMTSAAGAYLNGNIQVIDGGRIGQLQATY